MQFWSGSAICPFILQYYARHSDLFLRLAQEEEALERCLEVAAGEIFPKTMDALDAAQASRQPAQGSGSSSALMATITGFIY